MFNSFSIRPVSDLTVSSVIYNQTRFWVMTFERVINTYALTMKLVHLEALISSSSKRIRRRKRATTESIKKILPKSWQHTIPTSQKCVVETINAIAANRNAIKTLAGRVAENEKAVNELIASK